MTPPASRLYECRVMHHRISPRKHRFEHRVFMFWLDLDEIDSLSKRLHLFSRNRFNVYSFHDQDHSPCGGATAKADILKWLREQKAHVSDDDRIMLLTFPRVMGYVFNPVSFYFCFGKSGAPVCAVAEVGNTFGEMNRFLLPAPSTQTTRRFDLLAPKHFYVSPFSELDSNFHFQLRAPDERLAIRVDDYDGSEPVLRSALTGRVSPLNNARLAWFSLKYPFVTLKVILLIHWHALLLWLKKVPFIRKAANPGRQRDVLQPHGTLAKSST